MKLIKNLSHYETQVKQLFRTSFNDTVDETNCIIGMLDLTQAYGYIDESQDVLISMVAPVERIIHTPDNKQHTIVNLTCLSTTSKFAGHGYGLKLMQTVADELVDQYDSVVWQTQNWDIYKNFELVACTNKLICTYKPGLYPTPMLIIWDQPNVDLIIDIERTANNERLGIEQTPAQVTNMIAMYQNAGKKYLANPCAYLWYDPVTKVIEHLQYTSLTHLTWLMHSIQPQGEFFLFDEKDIHQHCCLNVIKQQVAITKTYKKSKQYFKNIKLNDYLV